MSHDHSGPSRRSFLKLLGVNTGLALYQSPVQLLIESIVMGAQRTAWAASTGVSARRYLHIIQEGAPPRWTFDLALTPYSSSGFVASAGLGTAYNFSSSGASLNYATIPKFGVNVPAAWGYTVASAAGGMRSLDPLLSSMLQIRGIYTGNPDHIASQALQFDSAGTYQSLTALSADASDNPIPAINVGASSFRFFSSKGKSAIIIPNNGNLLSSLLSPFTSTSSGTFVTNRNKIGGALDAAISALNTASEANHTGADQMSKASSSAKDLLSTGFGNLTTTWNTLLAKYTSLISRTVDPTRSLAGINDSAIVPDGTTKFQTNSTLPTITDIRSMITSSVSVVNLANHFAMAEYVLVNNLSSSVSIAPERVVNLAFNGGTTNVTADEHFVGGSVSTIVNTYLNLSYAACLLELIDQLKAKNIWSETVISIAGEFGRTPRKDGSGSDHGYTGSSGAIYSGAITSPLVLGNILNNAGGYGTWGDAAPVTQLGRTLNLNDWVSTIAYLLRTASPSTAATSLVVSNPNGGYDPIIEKARQI